MATNDGLVRRGAQSAPVLNLHQKLLLRISFLVHKYTACHHLDRQHVIAHADALQSFPGVCQAGDDRRRHSGLEVRELDVAWASSSLGTGDATPASHTKHVAHLYSNGGLISRLLLCKFRSSEVCIIISCIPTFFSHFLAIRDTHTCLLGALLEPHCLLWALLKPCEALLSFSMPPQHSRLMARHSQNYSHLFTLVPHLANQKTYVCRGKREL